jgi:hypothetical protein
MTEGAGPSWLGIGAQRSGTTWFTDLLLQHPDMGLAANGEKEQHAFDDAVLEGWDTAATHAYRSRFDRSAVRHPGEFTPFYLRALWVPEIARSACPDDVVVLVLLRDPVARFASAMRWYEQRQASGRELTAFTRREWVRDRTADAIWGGMYATQLRAWSTVFGRSRLVVQQYEWVRDHPQQAVQLVWETLGLEPVPLRSVTEPSRTSTATPQVRDQWGASTSLRQRLVECYSAEVAELERTWGIDRRMWGHFA